MRLCSATGVVRWTGYGWRDTHVAEFVISDSCRMHTTTTGIDRAVLSGCHRHKDLTVHHRCYTIQRSLGHVGGSRGARRAQIRTLPTPGRPADAADLCVFLPPAAATTLTFGVQPLRVEPSICNRRLRVSGLVATERSVRSRVVEAVTYAGRGHCRKRARSLPCSHFT